MTEPGDDCYFFYYSNCAKGDSCPFRHCEAAMGSETVCNLWQEGRCFRKTCKFRHMEIKKNRKEIACYWENQPAGCQKPHCAFRHEKPRIIDGIYVPASKVLGLNEEPPHEEPVLPSPAPLSTASNPQLRGVMKAETQENVPSPTHPPVVINPADDDEDEDDQFSEEGEDGTRMISPRKLSGGPNSDDLLNFGVRTLEEIRLRKALKASMKRAGYPVQSSDSSVSRNYGTNGEKENISSFVCPTLFPVRDDAIFEETEKPRVSIVDRLGKNILRNDGLSVETPLLKGRLANRLGRIVAEEDTNLVPQKTLKPVRDRLGRSVEPAVSADPAIITSESNIEPEKASEKIRIKTLEEIRQEKAAKAQTLVKKDSHAVSTTTKPTTATKPATRSSKRAITVKSSSIVQVKTFSEVLHAKRKQQEEDQHKDQVHSSKKTKHNAAEASKKPMVSGSTDTTLPTRLALPVPEVKVKTLEEIRREKVARREAEKAEASKNPGTGSSSEEFSSKKPQILRSNKPASPSSTNNQKTAVVKEKPEEPTTTTEPNPISGNILKVKTFEEIMHEKRLRKQQLEEQATSTSQSDGSADKESAPKPMASPTLESKALTKVKVMPPDAPSPVPHTTAPKTSVRQRVALQTEVTLRVPSTTTASASPKLGSPPQQAEADSPSRSPKVSASSPTKRKRTPPGPIAAKQSRGAASPGLSVEEPPVEAVINAGPKKSTGKATEAKVRPKLNVKPSMMKPAAQVRPGQKRKAAERSAVAAVKPLNSSASEPAFERDELADAKLSSTVPGGPSTRLGPGSNSSPLREELQAVPVKSLPTVSSISTTAVRETCPVPQSSVMKAAPQSKPRRISTSRAAPTTTSSAVDDFDELMNEFTDDHLELEGDMALDHGKGEDDLLLELSEMIDS